MGANAALQVLTPYLGFKDTAKAIEFYRDAFGAEEQFRLKSPDGKIGHAEVRICGATVMMSDEYPDHGAYSAQSLGGTPIKLHFYVDDVEAALERAVKAGATLLREARVEFYGDKTGMVADPFGYSWFFGQRVEEVSPEEMQRRWSEMMMG